METSTVEQPPEIQTKELSDDILITLFQGGDEHAFKCLVERYQERIRNVIYSVLQDGDFVDDIAQDVFIKVYQGLRGFRFQSSFYTWLYRIAVNKCRDEIRKKKVRKLLSLESMSEGAKHVVENRMSEAPVDYELGEYLNDCLQQLPEKYRIPVVLKDIDGLSYEEISEVTQCEMGTVKSRLSRARKMMREMLTPYLEGSL